MASHSDEKVLLIVTLTKADVRPFGRRARWLRASLETGCLRMQTKVGGKLQLRLNKHKSDSGQVPWWKVQQIFEENFQEYVKPFGVKRLDPHCGARQLLLGPSRTLRTWCCPEICLFVQLARRASIRVSLRLLRVGKSIDTPFHLLETLTKESYMCASHWVVRNPEAKVASGLRSLAWGHCRPVSTDRARAYLLGTEWRWTVQHWLSTAGSLRNFPQGSWQCR